MFRAGLLRLHWLEQAGRVIAAEYHLVGGRTLYVYQGGIDPDFLREEPGRLATIATLHGAIDDGFDGFDFCRGDEPYKAHWRQSLRKPSIAVAANRSVLDCDGHVGRSSQRTRLGPHSFDVSPLLSDE